MNTAISSCKIHFLGNCFVVFIGDKSHTCINQTQLLEAIKGRPPKPAEYVLPPHVETVDEYLARGGKITVLTKPKTLPIPKAISEAPKPIPSRLTFEALWGAPKKKDAV